MSYEYLLWSNSLVPGTSIYMIPGTYIFPYAYDIQYSQYIVVFVTQHISHIYGMYYTRYYFPVSYPPPLGSTRAVFGPAVKLLWNNAFEGFFSFLLRAQTRTLYVGMWLSYEYEYVHLCIFRLFSIIYLRMSTFRQDAMEVDTGRPSGHFGRGLGAIRALWSAWQALNLFFIPGGSG